MSAIKRFLGQLSRSLRSISSKPNPSYRFFCPTIRYESTAARGARPSFSNPLPPPSPPRGRVLLAAFAGGSVISILIGAQPSTRFKTVELKEEATEASKSDSKRKTFRISELKQHDATSDRPWVTKGRSVYDITDWVGAHPGGEVILRAAGGSIDPYWDIFTIHKRQDVYDILEQYLIGEIDPVDLVNGQVPVEDIEDPFANDPTRDPRLR